MDHWYLDRLDAAIRLGEWHRTLILRTSLDRADSPGIREYLRAHMLDTSLPDEVREWCGAYYFARLDAEEFLREFLRAFETMQMPWQVSWGQATRLLERDADRLLGEVGPFVRANPGLADQTAFTMIVEGAPRYASEQARRTLGEALQAGLDAAGAAVDGRLRKRLEGKVHDLRRPGLPR